MNFGSLFSGIGGIDLGLERAGMTCKWQVEIDDFCNKVLEKHWPKVKRYRDVREVGKHNLEPVDLIAGGFPCQPHSVAGKRRGKDDDRNLWPEYLRIIREVKPRWVVGENVPGIITTMLDDVLSDLEGADYSPTVFNIPACAFGANHIRRRIFIIAYANSSAIQEQRSDASKRNGFDNRNINLANTNLGRSLQGESEEQSTIIGEQTFAGSSISGENVADTQKQHRPLKRQKTLKPGCGSEDISNTKRQGLQIGEAQPDSSIQSTKRTNMGSRGETNHWSVEPNVGRVANGVPNRVDRLKSLGNAVVPQVAEYIGRCILQAEEG